MVGVLVARFCGLGARPLGLGIGPPATVFPIAMAPAFRRCPAPWRQSLASSSFDHTLRSNTPSLPQPRESPALCARSPRVHSRCSADGLACSRSSLSFRHCLSFNLGVALRPVARGTPGRVTIAYFVPGLAVGPSTYARSLYRRRGRPANRGQRRRRDLPSGIWGRGEQALA